MATQNTNTDSEPIRPIRTTIRIEHENGAFHATEPAGKRDLVGRGDTRTEAVRHYCDLIDEVKRGESQ